LVVTVGDLFWFLLHVGDRFRFFLHVGVLGPFIAYVILHDRSSASMIWMAHLLRRLEIYRRGALSTRLSTDGRERARVIRGLNKFCPGQPPPAADGDVLLLLFS
jgi:hypothetical protein